MAKFYLGEGGIANYDGDHIQARKGKAFKAQDYCCRTLWTCTQTHGTGQLWTIGPSEPVNLYDPSLQCNAIQCLNCQAGDGEQPDHLPLPLQPQLCPRTPGSRRRPSSGAIRWHIKLISSGFTFHMKGVCHGDELPLLFIPAVLTNSGDRQVSRLLVDWWTNFAKHG